MSKTHASPHDDAGKSVGSLDTKGAGALDKDSIAPDASEYEAAPGYDAASYGTDDSGGYDGGGGSSDGGGSGDGSSTDETTDDATAEEPGEPVTDDTQPDGDDDSALYAEGEADDPGDPITDELDNDNDDTKPGEPDDDYVPPNNHVSIDIDAMTRLVAAMERAGDQIVAFQSEMRSILSGVRLDTSQTTSFEQVSVWIEDELPGLRRRLAMAQDLAGESGTTRPGEPQPPVYRPYVGDESLIPDCPPSQSYLHGRETAQRFTIQPDERSTADLIARLKANQHDPYFAREFVHNADPETVVRAVLQATSDPEAASGEGEQLIALTASTVATASRGTGELAPPEGYEEQWAALRDGDDAATASLAAQLHPAPAE